VVRTLSAAAALALLLPACRSPAVTVQGDAPTEGFRDVVAASLPSIVFIQAEAAPPPGLELLLPGLARQPDGTVPIGAGSGVIFRRDGFILTNNHVVQDAERVLVLLHDRRLFEAQVVGRDPSTEVAVVRISGADLPVARFGDSDQLAIGDWVLAAGSPLGMQFSVTAGIVSGTGRTLGILAAQTPATEQAAALEHFIQTDASLSPGNSGGPLLNTRGEVIGINTAVAAPMGVPAGHGFAIPSNIALNVAEQLIRWGEVRRAFLGVALVNVTPAFARAHGLERVAGAVIMEAQPGSPAERGGLRQADVIVRIGGDPVQTVSDLQARLTRIEPGDRTTVRVLRQGREVDVQVEVGMVRSGVGPDGEPR
jgi:serine protease Do